MAVGLILELADCWEQDRGKLAQKRADIYSPAARFLGHVPLPSPVQCLVNREIHRAVSARSNAIASWRLEVV